MASLSIADFRNYGVSLEMGLHLFVIPEILLCDISGITTKAPREASAMHGRHVCKGIAASVLHTFVRKCAEKMSCFRNLLSAAGVCIP